MKSLEILWHKVCFPLFHFHDKIFFKLAFGTTSAVTLSALLSPLAKDGWFMTAISSSLLASYNNYFRENCLYLGIYVNLGVIERILS